MSRLFTALLLLLLAAPLLAQERILAYDSTAPARADASAASVPAWPPPMTMAS